MGNGHVEEQLIRLMVWVGAVTVSTTVHSRVYHPLDILRDGTAWCDQQVRIFSFFALHLAHVNCREYSIYHTDGANGHSVAEAYYHGGWHLYDLHSDHQNVYRGPGGEILSYEDICKSPQVVEAEGHWWRGNDGVGKIGFYTSERPPMIMLPLASYRAEKHHYINPQWDGSLYAGEDLVG